MKDAFSQSEAGSPPQQRPGKHSVKIWVGSAIALVLVVAAAEFGPQLFAPPTSQASTPPPSVAVSAPLERDLDTRLQFLGQFSAVEQVELRAQVGGTLTQIGFKDGDIVHKGDLLFVIDPAPYEIKLSQAMAQFESANARLELATRELVRANALKRTDAGTAQNVDQREAEKQAAQAAVDGAKAMVRAARFDLDHCRITAPFTGRIGTHLVSVGNLAAGTLKPIIDKTFPLKDIVEAHRYLESNQHFGKIVVTVD